MAVAGVATPASALPFAATAAVVVDGMVELPVAGAAGVVVVVGFVAGAVALGVGALVGFREHALAKKVVSKIG